MKKETGMTCGRCGETIQSFKGFIGDEHKCKWWKKFLYSPQFTSGAMLYALFFASLGGIMMHDMTSNWKYLWFIPIILLIPFESFIRKLVR